MVKLKIILSALILTALMIQPISAGVDIGLSLNENGVKEFYLAIGEHYNVPEKEIMIVRKKHIPEEELPVVFLIASKAGAKTQVIINMRLQGKSWMQITRHFGLSASIFYVEIKSKPGPPYGKAWGHFKNNKKTKWKEIRLTDADVVNFVNLKFIANHYGHSPDEVIDMRVKGRNFIEINQTFKQRKAAGKEKHANKKAHSNPLYKKAKKKNK